MVGPSLSFGKCSDAGSVRDLNEDCAALVELRVDGAGAASQILLAVVADGMGGHLAGEVASRRAADVVAAAVASRYAAQHSEEAVNAAEVLTEAFGRANEEVYELGQGDETKTGMGTTLTAALVVGRQLCIAHVGDSRAYHIRDRAIRRLTTDHSLVQEKLDAGLITEEEALLSEQRNELRRVVGIEPTVEADIIEEKLAPGDVVVLCTDGVHNAVSDDQLLEVVTENGEAQRACQDLVALAKAQGGSDNITAVCVAFPGEALAQCEAKTVSTHAVRSRRRLLQLALAGVAGLIAVLGYAIARQVSPRMAEIPDATRGAQQNGPAPSTPRTDWSVVLTVASGKVAVDWQGRAVEVSVAGRALQGAGPAPSRTVHLPTSVLPAPYQRVCFAMRRTPEGTTSWELNRFPARLPDRGHRHIWVDGKRVRAQTGHRAPPAPSQGSPGGVVSQGRMEGDPHHVLFYLAGAESIPVETTLVEAAKAPGARSARTSGRRAPMAKNRASIEADVARPGVQKRSAGD